MMCAGVSCTLSAQGMVDGFMRGKGNLNTAVSYSFESYDSYYIWRLYCHQP